MIDSHDIGGLQGAPVFGPDNEKVGNVGQVYVDPATDRPTWVSVRTGLFGRHESVVPLEGAEWNNERLTITYDKETLKAAPRYDTEGPLTTEQESELSRFYRLSDSNVDPNEAAHLRGDAVHERANRRASAESAADETGDPIDSDLTDRDQTDRGQFDREPVEGDHANQAEGNQAEGNRTAGNRTGREQGGVETATGPKHAAPAAATGVTGIEPSAGTDRAAGTRGGADAGEQHDASPQQASGDENGNVYQASGDQHTVEQRTVEQQAAARQAGDVSPEPTEAERLEAERARSHGLGTTGDGHPSPRDM